MIYRDAVDAVQPQAVGKIDGDGIGGSDLHQKSLESNALTDAVGSEAFVFILFFLQRFVLVDKGDTAAAV